MKKLLIAFLLIIAASIAKAQDTKPTKEETISYLKAVLLSEDNVGYWSTRSDGKYNYKISLIEFSVQNCILKFKEKSKKNDDTVEYKSYEYEFDLSKIEKVKTDTETKGYFFIRFYTVNHQSIIKEIYNDSKEQKESMTTSAAFCVNADPDRIFKAFNHLRKLCGAPEPIKFE